MYPKWNPVSMETHSQSPTRNNTPSIKAALNSTKKPKAWKCDAITPVSKVNGEITLLNPKFSISKRDLYFAAHPRLIAELISSRAEVHKNQAVALPLKTRSAPKSTLVLDMDGTLVHSTSDYMSNYDLRLDPKESSKLAQVYVKVRPYTKEFLEEISKHYETVLFTAAEVNSR
eukprot:TRINITY_DN11144_c0_g1_i16.p1 TRINITY_DN11144_c0_g1~~TRINITY_DN11144_c0_g1_i16.p1  ORF type:complete len:173 (-),score=22.29 TRINITY_DN11144_c0_g1_i16:101-619(-)